MSHPSSSSSSGYNGSGAPSRNGSFRGRQGPSSSNSSSSSSSSSSGSSRGGKLGKWAANSSPSHSPSPSASISSPPLAPSLSTSTSSPEDTFASHQHDRTLYLLMHLVGQVVHLTTRGGITYEGYFHAAHTDAAEFGVVLQMARILPESEGTEDEEEMERRRTVVVLAKDVVMLEASDTDFSTPSMAGGLGLPGFQTDGSISSKSPGDSSTSTDSSAPPKERQLHRWADWADEDEDDEGLNGLEVDGWLDQPAPILSAPAPPSIKESLSLDHSKVKLEASKGALPPSSTSSSSSSSSSSPPPSTAATTKSPPPSVVGPQPKEQNASGDGEPWDQFAANESLFGVRTDYTEEAYTTPLDRSAPGYAAREKEAERIAREILSQDTENAHMAEERGIKDTTASAGMDEEAKYGAVLRPFTPSRQQNKYVPPRWRQRQAAGGEGSTESETSKSSVSSPPVPPVPDLSVRMVKGGAPGGATVSGDTGLRERPDGLVKDNGPAPPALSPHSSASSTTSSSSMALKIPMGEAPARSTTTSATLTKAPPSLLEKAKDLPSGASTKMAEGSASGSPASNSPSLASVKASGRSGDSKAGDGKSRGLPQDLLSRVKAELLKGGNFFPRKSSAMAEVTPIYVAPTREELRAMSKDMPSIKRLSVSSSSGNKAKSPTLTAGTDKKPSPAQVKGSSEEQAARRRQDILRSIDRSALSQATSSEEGSGGGSGENRGGGGKKSIEQQVAGTFNKYVSTERERMAQKKQALFRKEKSKKIEELLSFSRSFQLPAERRASVGGTDLTKKNKTEVEGEGKKERRTTIGSSGAPSLTNAGPASLTVVKEEVEITTLPDPVKETRKGPVKTEKETEKETIKESEDRADKSMTKESSQAKADSSGNLASFRWNAQAVEFKPTGPSPPNSNKSSTGSTGKGERSEGEESSKAQETEPLDKERVNPIFSGPGPTQEGGAFPVSPPPMPIFPGHPASLSLPTSMSGGGMAVSGSPMMAPGGSPLPMMAQAMGQIPSPMAPHSPHPHPPVPNPSQGVPPQHQQPGPPPHSMMHPGHMPHPPFDMTSQAGGIPPFRVPQQLMAHPQMLAAFFKQQQQQQQQMQQQAQGSPQPGHPSISSSPRSPQQGLPQGTPPFPPHPMLHPGMFLPGMPFPGHQAGAGMMHPAFAPPRHPGPHPSASPGPMTTHANLTPNSNPPPLAHLQFTPPPASPSPGPDRRTSLAATSSSSPAPVSPGPDRRTSLVSPSLSPASASSSSASPSTAAGNNPPAPMVSGPGPSPHGGGHPPPLPPHIAAAMMMAATSGDPMVMQQAMASWVAMMGSHNGSNGPPPPLPQGFPQGFPQGLPQGMPQETSSPIGTQGGLAGQGDQTNPSSPPSKAE
ncbi:hypothetical protein BJ684DRAFT_17321 [Piptocephalis cylindrospora]|uniref:LsmAD domain-containing protein n=1 Tax=Piptocephalis cylindrospora TaxID=1907219 RepID=A0A4P9Y0H7_9FUNG|nr:hypothetical protein BJ684DRAFT_17321 [Piptocephalis cylindrospora]|eukprot:RKP12164.1 hypothetical protein BJ684DRAFT_17321 [Piptocephalis cylindrospora]